MKFQSLEKENEFKDLATINFTFSDKIILLVINLNDRVVI